MGPCGVGHFQQRSFGGRGGGGGQGHKGTPVSTSGTTSSHGRQVRRSQQSIRTRAMERPSECPRVCSCKGRQRESVRGGRAPGACRCSTVILCTPVGAGGGSAVSDTCVVRPHRTSSGRWVVTHEASGDPPISEYCTAYETWGGGGCPRVAQLKPCSSRKPVNAVGYPASATLKRPAALGPRICEGVPQQTQGLPGPHRTTGGPHNALKWSAKPQPLRCLWMCRGRTESGQTDTALRPASGALQARVASPVSRCKSGSSALRQWSWALGGACFRAEV